MLDLMQPFRALRRRFQSCGLTHFGRSSEEPRGRFVVDFVITAAREALVSIEVGRQGRIEMPRASWRGYLRLSLVSCPIYLSPATARTKPIRLHQVWRAAPAEGGSDLEDQVGGENVPERPASRFTPDDVEDRAEPTRPATRVTLRPHDPSTGEEVEKEEVVRGYEYERGQYITFTPDELKALDLESSKVIDLETFVPRGEVDPVYFNSHNNGAFRSRQDLARGADLVPLRLVNAEIKP